MRTIITTDKFITDVMRRLVKHYDRITVVRDEKDRFILRIVATSPSAFGSGDDFGNIDPVVVTGFSHPLPDVGPAHDPHSS
jgi:hypothetical protein